MQAGRTIRSRMTYTRIIALGYVMLILFGAVLLSLPVSSSEGAWTPFGDALFTSSSATCITGLIVYDTYTHWSLFGQIVILVLIQTGGLGFMTVVTLISVAAGKKLSLHERRIFLISAGNDSFGGAIKLIRSIFFGTLFIEACGAALLSIRFIPRFGIARGIYFSVFHSISAFCNAGFDLMGCFGESSLTAYSGDPLVVLTICGLIIFGGLGFIVINDVKNHGMHISKFQLHTKIVIAATAVLLVVGAASFWLFEYGRGTSLPIREQLLRSIFMSVTPRTAGFNTVDLTQMKAGAEIITMLLMIIGGAPGSTAGGIKVTTIVALLSGTLSASRKLNSVTIFRRRLHADAIRQASSIATLYFFISTISTLIIAELHPQFSFDQILFEVISAFSNVGMTLGITSQLSVISKMIIVLLMYCGRVGILSLAIVLGEKRDNLPVTRPAENIVMG